MKGENNLVIKRLIDKKVQRKNSRWKCIKGYRKLDFAIAVILVGAQLLTNTPNFAIRYSEMNNMSSKTNYMSVPEEYKNRLGQLCAVQNENVRITIKNLSEAKKKSIIKMEDLPDEREIATDMTTMAEETDPKSVDIYEKPTVTISDAAIPAEAYIDEKYTDENHTTEKRVEEITIDETQKEDSDVSEMPLAELTIVGNFAVNQDGIIEKCIDPYAASVDDTIILPTDKRCIGIGTEAFADISEVSEVMEVYIPANIIYIEPEAFEGLNSLIYIEVAEENPDYKSVEGVLYDREGNVIVYPAGRKEDA